MSASPPKGIAAAQFGINAAVARMAAAAAVVKRKRHMSSSLVGGYACQMEKIKCQEPLAACIDNSDSRLKNGGKRGPRIHSRRISRDTQFLAID